MSTRDDRPKHIFAPTAGVVALAIVWWLSSHSGAIGPTLIATPEEVLTRLINSFNSEATSYGQVHRHALATLARAVEGWGLGILIGSALGLTLARALVIFKSAEPVVEFVRAIPPILAFPLLLVAFNYNIGAYIWTVVFGCAPIMTISVAQGVREIDQERDQIFRQHQPDRQVRTLVRALEIVPSIFFGARVTFSFALIIAVVTEMVFTPRNGLGIGSIAKEAEISFDTPTFYAAVLLMGLIGYVGNQLLQYLERRIIPDGNSSG